MLTWHKGIQILRASHYMNKVDLKEIIDEFNHANLQYLPDKAAIFITDPYDQSGGSFLHYLKKIGILPERILIVSVVVEKYPYISCRNSFEVIKISEKIYRLILHFGFTQTLDVPNTLKNIKKRGVLPFKLDMHTVLYLVETIEIILTPKKRIVYISGKKVFLKC